MAGSDKFVTIVSEGHPSNSQVLLPSGEALRGVTKVNLCIDAEQEGFVEATITLWCKVNVKAQVQEILVDPEFVVEGSDE